MRPNPFQHDCIQWLGYKPCPHQQQIGLSDCGACTAFQPAEARFSLKQTRFQPSALAKAARIGIVEMGGLGSILRTTAVSRALRLFRPSPEIHWFTHGRGAQLLTYVPSVKPVDVEHLPVPDELVGQLDVVLNFELNETAAKIAAQAKSVGVFALNNTGKFGPASSDADYLQRMQIDDEFRRSQPRTMQEVLLRAAGLPHQGARYDTRLPFSMVERAGRAAAQFRMGARKLIGLNLGTSQRGALKRWPAAHWIGLAQRLAKRHQVVVLSGPEDSRLRQEFSELHTPQSAVVIADQREIGDFMALVRHLDVLVTGDSFAFHAARAVHTPAVVLSGPMPAQEIEVSVQGALIGPTLDCSPCYYRCRRDVLGECMHLIDVSQVASTTARVMEALDTISPNV
ncbi:MAG: glycosyltransferase family 9 protein [Corynebacteriales bacterium]|nr:glycosyltransferase family 9 protein [Mycobacteriales bacterium]